jgi:hypothetical protein
MRPPYPSRDHPLRARRHLGVDAAARRRGDDQRGADRQPGAGRPHRHQRLHAALARRPAAFVWFGNTGTYLLIGGMLAVEFSVRIWRFPDYRFKNPLQFAREARSRMPNIVAAPQEWLSR